VVRESRDASSVHTVRVVDVGMGIYSSPDIAVDTHLIIIIEIVIIIINDEQINKLLHHQQRQQQQQQRRRNQRVLQRNQRNLYATKHETKRTTRQTQLRLGNACNSTQLNSIQLNSTQ